MSQIPLESDYGAKEKEKVVLDAKATQSLVERLYSREADRIQRRNKAFEEAVDFQARHNAVGFKRLSSKLSPQEEVIVKNCYDNQVALLRKKKEMNEERLRKEAEVSTKRITAEDQEDIVSRLYNQSMETRKKNLETLVKKTYGSHETRGSSPAKKDRAEINAAVTTLYTEAIRKKKEADEKLEQKYAWKKVKCATLDPEEIRESANRLSSRTQ